MNISNSDTGSQPGQLPSDGPTACRDLLLFHCFDDDKRRFSILFGSEQMASGEETECRWRINRVAYHSLQLGIEGDVLNIAICPIS